MKTIKSLAMVATTCVILAGLGGCASNGYDMGAILQKGEIHHMSRSEVVSAVNDCLAADMRPNITKTNTIYNGAFIPNLPVDVTCEVSKKTMGEETFRPQQQQYAPPSQGYPVQQTTVVYPPNNSTGAIVHIVHHSQAEAEAALAAGGGSNQ